MKYTITGEEKHYQKLNSKLRKELKEFIESNQNLLVERLEFRKEFKKLQDQLECVIKENEFLKGKLNLTNDEVKHLVSASENVHQLFTATKSIFGGFY